MPLDGTLRGRFGAMQDEVGHRAALEVCRAGRIDPIRALRCE
jgi:hypothetical protein